MLPCKFHPSIAFLPLVRAIIPTIPSSRRLCRRYVGSSLHPLGFACSNRIRMTTAAVCRVNTPFLFADDFDRYPPESKYEEDESFKDGGDEAFHESYWRYSPRKW